MAEISSTQVLAPHIAIRKLIPVKLDLSEGDSDLDNEESSGSDVPHKQEDPEGDQNADSKADRKEDVAADQDDDAKSDQHGDEDVRKYEDSDLQRTVDVYSLREHMTQTYGLRGKKTEINYADEELFDCSKACVTAGGWQLESGLFKSIKMAYSGHYRLHLRPDDVWLAIAQGVSTHLTYQDNAEKYRKVFVDHEGKERS